MLTATECYIKHVVKVVLVNPGVNRYVSQTIEGAFSGLRVNLFRFLRSNISDWPLDTNFLALLSVWRAYVAPWTHLNLGEDPAYWNPYVLNNYWFYVIPFSGALEHLGGIIEALVALQMRTKLVLQGEDFCRRLAPHVDCLALALGTVSPVAELLRSVEAEELVSRRVTKYTEYRIPEQLAVLEPERKATATPMLFDSPSFDLGMGLIRCLDRAHGALRKLGQEELSLDGKILGCQDEIAKVFAITDSFYAKYLERADQKEAQAPLDSGVKNRHILPSTPDSKLTLLRSIPPKPANHYNDEIPILYTILSHASDLVNAGLRRGLMKASSRWAVPQWAFHVCRVNLRPLAIWQNLLFTLLAVSAAYILLLLIF